jgi:3-oxoacyl-[acyl-carrier-protein] synthase II|tara:strand:+ start:3410 stop:4654 length:1245 start_codon:yes stop_codon:yes gene_type:complete
MSIKKVVITGLGALAPNGNSADLFWSAIKSSTSGIAPISYFDASNHRATIAGELKDFDAAEFIDSKEIRKLDPFSIFALVASIEAIESAKIDLENINLDRAGVIIGTGIGGIQTLENEHDVINAKGSRRVSPQFVAKMIPNIAGGHLSMKFGFRGPSQTVISACASSNDAIGIALRLIRYGDADIILTGGTDASITPLTIAGFANMRALSQNADNPTAASRPFDADRDGFVLSEGSGMLVIESEEHALKRGAPILAELAGYGSTDDAFHITQPAPEGLGAYKAMENAILDSEINPGSIDYINAHGTSTPFNDKNESKAIANLFRDSLNKLKISSTKSMTGHLLGAAGGLEAIATVKSIVNQIIPPTINYETPDPECATLDYTPNHAVEAEINSALSNTFGFGGHNAVLCFRKYN